MMAAAGVDREFDLCVLGATGFTGKEVCVRVSQEIARLRAAAGSAAPVLRWCISGRREETLESVTGARLDEAGAARPDGVLVADVQDAEALRGVVAQCKLVLNCTGPFRYLGEHVVKACVEAGTDVMDISGEPQYMESTFLNFHEEAREKGVLVMHACAFDSVPADIGSLFTARQFGEDPSMCSGIESFLTFNCGPQGMGIHYTTYECAVLGIGDAPQLRTVRRAIADKFHPARPEHSGPRLNRNTSVAWEARENRYCTPFMGSDASVVRMSQRALVLDKQQLVAPQYAAYVTISSAWYLPSLVVMGGLFQTLCGSSWGRSVALNCPGMLSGGLVSHAGPSREQMENTSFTMRFYARGYSADEAAKQLVEAEKERDESSAGVREEGDTQLTDADASAPKPPPVPKGEPDRTVVANFSGPEPGYVATPMIFVALARCVLEERSALPSGGVYTPGGAFYDVLDSVVNRLREAGITLEVESEAEST